MFPEALADPKHPEHDDLLDWHGDPFEAEGIDEEIVRIQMRRVAKARRAKR
jgi:hypothetical protein